MKKAEDFYNNISKYYNEIFPVEQGTLNFLKKHFTKGNILDVACGCGEYTIALLKEGYDVYGNDLSKDMIGIAKKYNDKRFFVSDMSKLGCPINFNNIFCIGTSLAHLQNKNHIFKTLKGFYARQEKNGVLILQIVNFDRIIERNITTLPKISTKNIDFERNYTIKEDKINFNTKLNVSGEIYENNVDLFALKSELLKELLLEAGYSDITLYNGFSDESFDIHNSFALVLTAIKKQ